MLVDQDRGALLAPLPCGELHSVPDTLAGGALLAPLPCGALLAPLPCGALLAPLPCGALLAHLPGLRAPQEEVPSKTLYPHLSCLRRAEQAHTTVIIFVYEL